MGLVPFSLCCRMRIRMTIRIRTRVLCLMHEEDELWHMEDGSMP